MLTLIFTSGSTGRPKGVVIYEHTWSCYFALGFPVPHIKLSYTFSEGRNDLLVLSSGGQIGLYAGNLGLILEDLQALRPSLICTTPRLYNIAFGLFQDELARAPSRRPQLLQRFRTTLFGDRIAYLKIGGAPCSAPVLAWMKECWSTAEVSDSYGASEVNGIARDGLLLCGWRLEDWECYRQTDQPHPRGELLVRAGVPCCYWRNDEANAEAFTDDGFYRTGDIVQLVAPHRIVMVDRKKHLFKLNFGVYVAPEKIENLLSSSELVDQLCILPDASLSYLIAIVVPRLAHLHDDPAQLQVALLQDFTRLGLQQQLRGFEIPRAILIDPERFTPANGQMSEGLKLLRHHIRRLHADRLEHIQLSGPASDPTDAPDPIGRWLQQQVPWCLGLDPAMVTTHTDLTQLGLTSMGSIRLLKSIQQQFGLSLSLKILFQHPTIATLTHYLASLRHAADAPARLASPAEPTIDWAAECRLDQAIRLPAEAVVAPGGDVLLTGATGFLGAFMLAALLRHYPAPATRVYCVVRAPDAVAARARLQQHLEALALWEAVVAATPSERIVMLPAALDDFAALLTPAQSAGIREVYHCAAQVNSVLPYAALRQANVDGTTAVLRFCADPAAPKHLHYISTLSVLLNGAATGRHERVALLDQLAEIEGKPGYHQSKYVAERLVQEASEHRHLSVSIYRPGMISASTLSGACNVADFDTRLILGILQLGYAPILPEHTDTAFDQTPVDYVADTIAHIGRQRIVDVFHFSNPQGSVPFSQWMAWLRQHDPDLQPVPYPDWVLSHLIDVDDTNPLHPLVDAYFRGTLAFPCRHSLQLAECQNTLQHAPYPPPIITQATFLKMIDWLKVQGLIVSKSSSSLKLLTHGQGIPLKTEPTIDDIIFW